MVGGNGFSEHAMILLFRPAFRPAVKYLMPNCVLTCTALTDPVGPVRVSCPETIQAHAIFTSWDEATARVNYPWHVNYGNFGPLDLQDEVDYFASIDGSLYIGSAAAGWKEWDATESAQMWYNGTIDNEGMVLPRSPVCTAPDRGGFAMGYQ